MSLAFTSPADASWQTLLDELTLAYSERRQAIGQSTYTAQDDCDVQAVTYWTVLQSWLETNCSLFIDDISGPLNPDGTAFLYFTLATFRSAAGLDASGFRRVPEGVEWDGINDPVWSYGQMQAGDIIGPWIFEDLQKAFGALKWTEKDANELSTSKANGGDGLVCATVKTDAISAFNSTPFLNWAGDTSYLYGVYAYGLYYEQGGQFRTAFYAGRVRGQSTITGFSAPVPFICCFYGIPTLLTGSPVLPFWDGDGLGLEEGKLFLFDTTNEVQTTSVTSSLIGDYTANPIEMYPLDCPLSLDVVGGGCLIGQSTRGLFKWNFTNA
jgi:hypothetical protein